MCAEHSHAFRNGEVSTRLIVGLAVVGVLAAAAVPAGFFLIPHIKKLIWPVKAELLYEETFEQYKAGEEPEGWLTSKYRSGNNKKWVSGVGVNDRFARKGEKCIAMTPAWNFKYGSFIYRELPPAKKYITEFDVMLTSEANYRAGPKGRAVAFVCISYGYFYLHKWPAVCLRENRPPKIYDEALDEVTEFRSMSNKWYHVRLTYIPGETTSIIEAEIEGEMIARREKPRITEGTNSFNGKKKTDNPDIFFCGYDGEAYFDNIRVFRAEKK